MKKEYLNIFDFIVKKKIKSSIEYKTSFTDISEKAIFKMFELYKEKEFLLQRTLVGPHTDDLIFYFNDSIFKNVGSLGQMRIIGIVLKLLYVVYMIQEKNELPVVLIDDVLLELDEFHKNNVVDFLNQYSSLQTFECSTTKQLYKNLDKYNIVTVEDYAE